MEYSPNNLLQRQRSCACPSLNIAGWCSGDYSYDKLDCLGYNPPPARSVTGGRLRWKGLWKRMVNKKRRIFDSSAHSAPANAPYDSYSYAQNFDDGSAWVEPENLSRSFSARFAASSGVLQRFG